MTPLFTIQPALDARNAWVALLVEGIAPFDGAALGHLLFDLGLDRVLETLPCAVEADAATVDPDLARPLPRGRLVLRIPVSQADDSALHPTLSRLREEGFGLMAVGFPPPQAELFPKLTSLAVPCPGRAMPAGLGDWLSQLPGPHLAMGTTEHVCPGFCRFHWLGGHLAGHAAPPASSDPTARSLLLRLLSLVMADADADELEILIRRDTHLSYSLLKLVNSVAFAPSRKIDSFGQAISMLGRRQLQRWLQLLLYVRPQGSDIANPLLPRAALRASLMESIARRRGLSRDVQEHAFMTGMFSLLDLLLRMPFEKILAPLRLPQDVELALTARSGVLGSLMTLVEAGERNDLARLPEVLAAAGVDQPIWAAALIESAGWAARISKEA